MRRQVPGNRRAEHPVSDNQEVHGNIIPGVAVSGRTSTEPGAVWRSAPSTDSQNCCGSHSPRPIGTHAAWIGQARLADPPGKRPGEGDVIAHFASGEAIVRYEPRRR